jgi:hypothetical protein
LREEEEKEEMGWKEYIHGNIYTNISSKYLGGVTDWIGKRNKKCDRSLITDHRTPLWSGVCWRYDGNITRKTPC